MGGTLQEERERSGERSPGPLGLGSLLSSQTSTPTPKPHPGRMGPGGIGGRPGRSGEAGRRGPKGGAEGVCPAHLGLGSLLGFQVRSPTL